jgi:adenylate cyclase
MNWGFALPLFSLIVAGFGLAVLLAVAAAAAIFASRSARITRQFHALPGRVKRALLRNPRLAAYGMRRITVLSCRIAAAEGTQSDATRLSQLLSALRRAVLSQGGAITRFGGDGLLAIWNAPLPDPDAIVHATHAAQAVRAQVRHAQANGFTLSIGVSSADTLCGPLAGVYSVFGTAVERATELTKNADGFAVVCDGATAAVAGAQFALLPLDMPDDAASENQHHAVLGDQGVRASPQFRAAATFHARIFDAMAAGEYAAARDLVAQARRLSGASQSLYDRYDEHIIVAANAAKNTALKRAG